MSERGRPKELFVGLPPDWIPTAGFKECPGTALKILTAIVHHWVTNGFKDNCNLVITYKMLRAATGIGSKETISLGLQQLAALRILIVNKGKWSPVEQQRQPTRYGLPWISGPNGGPPIKGYLEIKTREEAKRLLKGLTEKERRKARKIRVIVEFEDV